MRRRLPQRRIDASVLTAASITDPRNLHFPLSALSFVNPDYLLRRIAEEYVLVPVAGKAAKSSQIIAINQTAGEICELIAHGADEKAIVEELLQRYDADTATLAEDVALVVRQLSALHAVIA